MDSAPESLAVTVLRSPGIIPCVICRSAVWVVKFSLSDESGACGLSAVYLLMMVR